MYQLKLIASASLSILATLFYKRLPILKDNVALVVRIPLTVMILAMPQYLVMRDHKERVINSMMEIYKERKESYKKYL